MHFLRKIFCLTVLTAAAAGATELNVFAVGNSLTDGLCWTPTESGATNGGFFDYVNNSGPNHLSGSKAVSAGAPLSAFWHNDFTNSPRANYQVLTNSGWDVLVLQPYDRMLYDNKIANRAPPNNYEWGDISNSVNFIKFALQANPNIQVYIYSQWPSAPTNYQRYTQIMGYINPATGTNYTWAEADAYRRSALSNYNFDVKWNTLYSDLNGYANNQTRSYYELVMIELDKQKLTNLAHEIRMIPVGDVLYALNQKMKSGALPGFTNITQVCQDVPHLRPGIGRLIMAATWYAALFQQSPAGLDYTVYNVESNSPAATNFYGPTDVPYYVEIPPQFASLVHSTAWEVVRSHPFAGVVPIDFDRDGLPNSWEKQYFNTTTNVNPGTMSSNGVNTLIQTYIAGLNPLTTNRFQLQMQISGGGVCSWSVISGRVYDIYFTTNLFNNFTPLYTNVPWTANSFTNAGTDEGFYRINVRLP